MRIKIYKKINISASHKLDLPYDSPCNRVHGHNYKIEIWIDFLKWTDGIILDFQKITDSIKTAFDHKDLGNMCVENFTEIIFHNIAQLLPKGNYYIKVRVWETNTCYAEIDDIYVVP